MRISKAQAEENHRRIVETASALFRARGFDGVAVSDLMKEAGFTHGGFYNHFVSKEDLAREALKAAWSQMAADRARASGLDQLLEHYLSETARAAPSRACPAAALAGDVSRQAEPVKAVFADGLETMIAQVQQGLEAPEDPDARGRAVALVARMVGALALSRAVPIDHPLAHELLEATLADARASLSRQPSRHPPMPAKAG